MAWRLAKSLGKLRDQINARYPNRSKVSDGAVGDLRHQSGTSDHNPREGVVTAIDITNDPRGEGPDLAALVPQLLLDPRVKYLIFDRKIYNPVIGKGAGRLYHGSNPHQKHMHVSVDWDKKDQDHMWALTPGVPPLTTPPPSTPIAPPTIPVELKRGSKGKEVLALQTKLQEMGHYTGKLDGDYGPMTEAAVKAAKADPKLLTKAQNAIKFFIEELDYSRIAATSLVANLIWESGGNTLKQPAIKYAAHGDKGKDGKYHSHGAGQWNDKHGRWDGLVEFATARGTTWQDPETQLLWLDKELKSTERRAAVELRDATTLEEGVKAAIKIWRPGVPHADKRLAVARKLWGETDEQTTQA